MSMDPTSRMPSQGDPGGSGAHSPQGGSAPPVGVVAQHGRPGVYIYPFWQRTEFWVMALTSAALFIAAAVDDGFDARAMWTLVTALGVAYIVSRGLAKREPRDDGADRAWTAGAGS